jgi:hypothetical protein
LDDAVKHEENPQRRKDGVFRGFLCGVAIGAVFGLLTKVFYEGYGPYQTQIWTAFWALFGGAAGLVFGVAHRS